MAAFIVETRGLTRRFGKTLAVDRLNLRVPAGSVYGFLGPNGAGKTTTLRMLLQLIRPSSGEVDLFGTPFAPRRVELLRKIGALVEMPSLYPHLTARENLEVTCRTAGFSTAGIQPALKTVDLEKDSNRLVRGFSLGMRQRLGLALALLGNPVLLILDEPTNGLDPAGIHDMRDLIAGLPRDRGITVLLSSHLLSEVEQVATHIGIIRKGSLIFEGTLDQLQAERQEFLSLQVSDPDRALPLLRDSGWRAEPESGSRLRVAVNGLSDAAWINALLVKAGLCVYHLSLEEMSLEQIFLKLTASQSPTEALPPSPAVPDTAIVRGERR